MHSPQTVKIADQLFEIAERLRDAEPVRPAQVEPLVPRPVCREELTVRSARPDKARPRRARAADRIRPHPSERVSEKL